MKGYKSSVIIKLNFKTYKLFEMELLWLPSVNLNTVAGTFRVGTLCMK